MSDRFLEVGITPVAMHNASPRGSYRLITVCSYTSDPNVMHKLGCCAALSFLEARRRLCRPLTISFVAMRSELRLTRE